MASPFDTPPAIDLPSLAVAATDAQISFITKLIAERNWQQFEARAYVTRVASISAIINLLDDSGLMAEIDGGTAGERVNQLFARCSDKPEYAPLTKQGASALIDWLKAQPVRARPAMTSVEHDNWSQDEAAMQLVDEQNVIDAVPAGRYALDTSDGAINAVAFYRVDRPTEGKWAGYVFVKHIIGGDEYRMSLTANRTVLAKIAEVGAEAASARYGREIGRCGVCHTRLTNDESRARGIGPKCAENQGW